MSKKTAAHLMSFPAGKKVAFLLLLYERMIPALRSFCDRENRDFSAYQRAREEFWQSLKGSALSVQWTQLRKDILDATPDTEDFGSLEASFALDAALVAADIAGLLADGQDDHIVESLGYAHNSIGKYVMEEMGVRVVDYTMVRTLNERLSTHSLARKEAKIEEDDVAFLSAIQDTPWPENIFFTVRDRTRSQGRLLDEG